MLIPNLPKWILLVCLILFPLLILKPVYANQYNIAKENQTCTTIEIFTRKGCPHCVRAKGFLQQLNSEYPYITVIEKDINENQDNTQRFINLNEQYQIEKPGVPSFLICKQFLVGYDDVQTSGLAIKQILGLIDKPKEDVTNNDINTSLFSSLSVDKLGLPLFTIVIGLLDGFNPCAMWVLLLLLSILVNLKDRKKIFLIAGTFVFISGAVYFVFMSAWLNLFLIIGFSRIIQLLIAGLALLIGSVHIKDFFAFKQGVSLSIPDSVKPSIYARIRNVIHADNMTATMIAIITVAIMVNMVELLCTAGLPAVYTQILTSKQLDTLNYYGYLLLYNIAYIFDDALMVGIAVYTMTRYNLQEKHGRWLKLLSGAVIFILGLALIFVPDLLI